MIAKLLRKRVQRAAAVIPAGLVFLTAVYQVMINVALADENVSGMELVEGQVWSFEGGKPGEELIIGHLETIYGEKVVSISLLGVVVPDDIVDAFGGQSVIQISHMPFSEEALRSSLKTLISSNASLPGEFEEGYNIWKQAMENEGAGFFTVSVSEGRNFILSTVAG